MATTAAVSVLFLAAAALLLRCGAASSASACAFASASPGSPPQQGMCEEEEEREQEEDEDEKEREKAMGRAGRRSGSGRSLLQRGKDSSLVLESGSSARQEVEVVEVAAATNGSSGGGGSGGGRLEEAAAANDSLRPVAAFPEHRESRLEEAAASGGSGGNTSRPPFALFAAKQLSGWSWSRPLLVNGVVFAQSAVDRIWSSGGLGFDDGPTTPGVTDGEGDAARGGDYFGRFYYFTLSKEHMQCAIGSTFTWALLVLLVATFHHHARRFPPLHKPGMDDLAEDRWHFSLFFCCERPDMSIMAFFCLPIRWADNMLAAGFMPFGVAVYLMVSLVALDSLSPWFAFFLISTLTYYRQQLRAKFSIPSGGLTIAQDCCAATLLPCCMVVQEARQLEHAYKSRHPAVMGQFDP